MPSPRTLTVISLGGGVQSSVMVLMAGGGAFDRVPNYKTHPGNYKITLIRHRTRDMLRLI